MALAALICLSLLAAFSTSGAQGSRSLPTSLKSQIGGLEQALPAVGPDPVGRPETPTPNVEYFSVEATKLLDDGRIIELVKINGPPTPPLRFDRPVVDVQRLDAEASSVILSEVPAYNWSYGCSATSAAMIAGYYDRTSYPNMYTGPTNAGVMPMDNSVWGYTTWPRCDHPGTQSDVYECPLSATRNGVDGRSTRGHVDDYWEGYACSGPDPYQTNGWAEHTLGSCTGDYMKTNKWFPEHDINQDGATLWAYYTDGARTPTSELVASGPPWSYDGGVGMELFYESRGYAVTTAYNQLIRGQGSNPTLGFTYSQYKAEIDAGRPVLIHIEGHTMVGVGYDDASSDLVYVHDTWDYDIHSMTWGGSYEGMPHQMVTVVHLEPPSTPGPTVTGITPSSGVSTGSVHITNLAGSHFQSGATVKLVRSGQADINATNVTVVNASKITCDFDLTGAATGFWDVIVRNPGPSGQSAQLNEGFRVLSPGDLDNLAYLPLILKRHTPPSPPPTPTPTATPTADWVTIVSEDFEGPFPNGAWDVHDNRPANGRYYWGKRDCRSSGGSFSAWSVGAGDTVLSCGSDYPTQVQAWMVYGPFSLTDATAAELSFDWWSRTEMYWDTFSWGASVDGQTYFLCSPAVSGDWSSWTTGELFDLSAVPELGNLLGEDQVWIAFVFTSSLFTTYEGTYVDNILLRKHTGSSMGMERVSPASTRSLLPEQTPSATMLRLEP
jgi:hypothetical protein